MKHHSTKNHDIDQVPAKAVHRRSKVWCVSQSNKEEEAGWDRQEPHQEVPKGDWDADAHGEHDADAAVDAA